MGVKEVYRTSRLAEDRSIQRAITARVLAKLRNADEERILKQAWPRDETALLLLKSAVSPTSTSGAS